jgi:hypothetical protein
MSLSVPLSQPIMSSRFPRRRRALSSTGVSALNRPLEDPFVNGPPSPQSSGGSEVHPDEERVQGDSHPSEQAGSSSEADSSAEVLLSSPESAPNAAQLLPTADNTREEVSSELTQLRRELKETDRHFAKIAARFTFTNDVKSYSAWATFFRAEMENCELADMLVPTGTTGNTVTHRMKQKTLYHMILQCVPAEARRQPAHSSAVTTDRLSL